MPGNLCTTKNLSHVTRNLEQFLCEHELFAWKSAEWWEVGASRTQDRSKKAVLQLSTNSLLNAGFKVSRAKAVKKQHLITNMDNITQWNKHKGVKTVHSLTGHTRCDDRQRKTTHLRLRSIKCYISTLWRSAIVTVRVKETTGGDAVQVGCERADAWRNRIVTPGVVVPRGDRGAAAPSEIFGPCGPSQTNLMLGIRTES